MTHASDMYIWTIQIQVSLILSLSVAWLRARDSDPPGLRIWRLIRDSKTLPTYSPESLRGNRYTDFESKDAAGISPGIYVLSVCAAQQDTKVDLVRFRTDDNEYRHLCDHRVLELWSQADRCMFQTFMHTGIIVGTRDRRQLASWIDQTIEALKDLRDATIYNKEKVR